MGWSPGRFAGRGSDCSRPKRKGRRSGSAAHPTRRGAADLEVDAGAELHQALLALGRVAREGVRLAEAVEHRGILLVEQVEDLGDQLDPDVAGKGEVARQADVELRERRAALAVDVRRARLDVTREAV